MNLRFIDWIWHVRGSLPLAPGQLGEDAFQRLDLLFRQNGTNHDRTGDILTFMKKDQSAQDDMSIFDGGTLRVENGDTGSILRYHLISRALLLCFLAPLFFLAMAQVIVAVNSFYAPGTSAAAKLEQTKEAAKRKAAQEKLASIPMNPIDRALGAPAPEKPAKNDKKKADSKQPTTTPAYVFAGIFAALYVIGRILEDRLIRFRFRKRLFGSELAKPA